MMDQIEESVNKPELEAFLRQEITASGRMTFADFMAQCLYHPRWGYYMGQRDRIGKGGDFFTSSSVHSLFGRLIGRQLHQMWELLGRGEFTIAEQGAGEGHLCLDVLDGIAEEFPEFYARLTYLLIEISPDNQQRQQNQLAQHKERLRWVAADDCEPFEGCFLSNELVDAFPVHLVEKRDGKLQEVFVVNSADGFSEELCPLSTPLIEEYFSRIGVAPVEGNRGEVNLAAVDWMRYVASRVSRGFVMTIDYGYPAQEYYSPLRRTGTLMCYYRHTSSEKPFQNIGNQDITAHVDFSTLQIVGQEEGLESLYFAEQYRFLMGLGFVESLIELEQREPDEKHARALRLTLKNLILPDGGMGETFKVLIQGKGVGKPELLCSRPIAGIPLPPGGFPPSF